MRAVLDQIRRCGDLTVPQMARTQELSRQFVQRMVNAAASTGWVKLIDSPVHRRSALVRLTESGADAIDALTVPEHRLLGRIGGNLTGADIGTTVRILDAMCAGLDDVDAEQADDR